MERKKYFDMLMKTVKEIARSSPGHLPVPPPAETSKHAPEFIRELEQKMVRCVVEETQYEDLLHDLHYKDLLHDLRWNKLTDSGGQPQFLEILPIFMHHISLGIFTVKLNERLDHYPMIEYYDERGKPVGQPYRSRFSHEQILRYCMRALVSQGKGKTTKFLFLGTHRDLKDDCVGESIAQKNAKLRAMVRTFNMEENVVYCNRNFDPIFAIDAKNPKAEDWEVMKEVREVIVQSSDVPPVDIPIKWFALELALLQFVEEKKQAVLPEATCFEMVANFHFDRASFKAALRYLHQVKLIFYYESMQLIVADIQVFLDILSEVVRYNIELITNPSQPTLLEYKWKKFCRHGILHASCLDKFPDHYVQGVFSPKELLQMFTSLCIVSALGSDEYLMPCVLPVEEKALCYPEAETLPAMVVELPDGGPMLGSFCGLVCYLIHTRKWELLKDEFKEPSHLTRNSIHFSAPQDLPGRVIVSDPLSSFFLVTFEGPPDVATDVCPLIRETILAGIEQVSKNLNYLPLDTEETDSVGSQPKKPVITFLCPCKATPLHPATMSANGKYLKCYESKVIEICEKVTPEHMTWFGGECSSSC